MYSKTVFKLSDSILYLYRKFFYILKALTVLPENLIKNFGSGKSQYKEKVIPWMYHRFDHIIIIIIIENEATAMHCNMRLPDITTVILGFNYVPANNFNNSTTSTDP